MANDPQADRDFANVLVELDPKLVDAVRKAMRHQRTQKDAKPLDQVLLEMKLITPERANDVRSLLKGKTSIAVPVPGAPTPATVDAGGIRIDLSEPEARPARPEDSRPEARGITDLPGYEIIKRLGAGAAGTVYLARQLSIDRLVAIKILTPRLAADATFVERFRKEAKTAAKLNHSNIITAFDVGEHPVDPARGGPVVHYFVMEYVDGPTVKQLLNDCGRLPDKTVVDIGLQIARALEVANRAGIVHRDIKPENMITAPDGIVKLCDLGLARESGTKEEVVRAAGTPRYISPEQAKGDANLDIRSDLYSLGATLYHLVTGEVPFPADTPEQMMARHVAERLVPPKERCPEVDERLSDVISRLMLKDRADRYQTPGELIAALQPLGDALKTRALPPVAAAVRAAPARRAYAAQGSRLHVIAAATAIVVLIGTILFLLRGLIFTKPTGDSGKHDGGTTADDPAKTELEEIARAQNGDHDFERMAEHLQRYDAYCDRHRGTVWEGRALEERAKYVEQADRFAKTDLEGIRQKESPLRASEKWREILALYGQFPKKFLDTTPSGKEVKEEIARVMGRCADKVAAGKARLTGLVRERKYDEALALIAELEGYALESVLTDLARIKVDVLKKRGEGLSTAEREVADKYLSVETRMRDHFVRREYRGAILMLVAFLGEEPWTAEQQQYVQVPEVNYKALRATLEGAEDALAKRADAAQACTLWETAAQTCETYGGDPGSPAEAPTAQRVLLDLRNALWMELLRQQMLQGLDRCIRGRDRIALETYGGDRGHFEVSEARIVFVPDGKAQAVVDPGRDLVELDWVTLAARTLDADAAVAAERAKGSPKFLARSGILYYFGGKGMLYAARAHEALTKGAAAGVKGVRIYLADLLDLMKKQEEAQLSARFDEATKRVQKRNWQEARAICEELLRSNATWVAERRSEISRMLSQIEGELDAVKKLEAVYHGRVEALPEGRIRVTYDFEDKTQADAFEVMPLPSKGRWIVERGGLESSKLASAVRWRTAVKGDVEVEYALAVIEDPPQNIVTSLYYSVNEKKHYSVTFAFDLVTGAADKNNTLEDKMVMPRTCVIKYPVSFEFSKAQQRTEWDKVRERLVGTPKAEFKPKAGASYRVRITRAGKGLRVSVDDKAVWEGEDAEYSEGNVLFFSDSRVRVDNLSIAFKPQ